MSYKIRKVQCLFVIAGNYDDFKQYEKSLIHLNKAYSIAEEIADKRLIAKALLNIGNNYEKNKIMQRLSNIIKSLLKYQKMVWTM